MFRLDDKHLEKAKEMALRNRKKKRCDVCFDRGYVGYTPENLLVVCHKCVNFEATMDEWKEYVSQFPDLKEHFSELFEEKKNEATDNKLGEN